MAAQLMESLRGVYDEPEILSADASREKRSRNFEKLRRLRLVWDRREDKALPFQFSFVLEGKIAGMALPTSQGQVLKIAQEHSIGI